jgi:anti-sigma factor RsiW
MPDAESDPHPKDLLAAYALGSLDADEAASVAAHLAGCPGCAAEVARLRGAVDLLPLAAPPVAPPPGSRDALLARVRRARAKPDR